MKNFIPNINPVENSKDYPFLGGVLDRQKILIGGDWRKYLPTDEAQATRNFDPFSCVPESLTNCIEMILKRLIENNPEIKDILVKLNALDSNGNPNFSGRWLAKMAGVVPGRGTTQNVVLDAICKYGLVGESVWPKGENMTQAEYYCAIPQDIIDKGLEFKKYFEFGYESLARASVFSSSSTYPTLKEALEYSPLWLCVDGNYEVNPDATFGEGKTWLRENIKTVIYNHATTSPFVEGNNAWIYDTYDPFLKKFEAGYPLGYAKSIHLKLLTGKKKPTEKFIKVGSAILLRGLGGAYKDKYIGFEDGDVAKAIFGDYSMITPRAKYDELPEEYIGNLSIKVNFTN